MCKKYQIFEFSLLLNFILAFFAFTTVYVFGLKNQIHLLFLLFSLFLRLFFFLSVRLR